MSEPIQTPQSDSSATSGRETGAVEFTRPLQLTPREDLRGYILSKLGSGSLFLITCTSVIAVLLIFYFIAAKAWPFFEAGGAGKFLSSSEWYPEAEPHKFGALSLIVGSLYVMFISLLIAVPLGLLTAVFLSDIAPFRLRQYIKPIIELLAAIPSVAYGFFAVLVLAPWLQTHLGLPTGRNALNAGLILAIMAIPTIVSVAEDALSSIGRELREGAYALGATRAETITQVIMPSASGGIMAAVILGMMRAIGETMVVWMASGNAAQIPSPWWDISQSVRTITATVAGEMGESVQGSSHYQSLFALGFMLLVFTFVLNHFSEWFLARTKRAREGK